MTGIEPGLSLHDVSALISPIVSFEPLVSMQILYVFACAPRAAAAEPAYAAQRGADAHRCDADPRDRRPSRETSGRQDQVPELRPGLLPYWTFRS